MSIAISLIFVLPSMNLWISGPSMSIVVHCQSIQYQVWRCCSPLSSIQSSIQFKKAKQWEISCIFCLDVATGSTVQVCWKVNGGDPTPVQTSQRTCRVRYVYNSSTVLNRWMCCQYLIELRVSSLRGLFRQMAARCKKVYACNLDNSKTQCKQKY